MRSVPAARRLIGPLAIVALLLGGLALYVLRLDNVAGLIGDDAWYVVLAKGIAQGSGLYVISSAGTQFLSQVYPPGFPAILSLVMLISPAYPANMALLKGISIAAMLGAGVLTYRYASRYRGLPPVLAVTVAIATVITPALVFLATSTLMSEGVFLFVEMAAVLLIERTARADDERTGRRHAAGAGALAAAAFLIRTAGMTIGLSALLYFAWKRRWQSAAVYAATAACLVMPWMVYARVHAPARADIVDHGGLMSMAYTDQFWTKEAGTVTSRHVGVRDLPARVERNVVNIAIRDMGGIFVPLMFRTPGESGLEVIGLGPPEGGSVPSMGSALGTKVVSLALSALALLGFVAALRRQITTAEPLVVLALGMIVLWPFWTFRFVLPLVPFLLCYFVLGIDALARAVTRSGQRIAHGAEPAARIFLFVIVGLNLLDHVQYVAQAHSDRHSLSWPAHADDIDQVLDWIRKEATHDGAIAADNPALVFLRTGRQTISSAGLDDKWARWQRMGVRYVVSLSDGELLEDRRATLRFKLKDQNVWAYELTGDQSSISTTQSFDRSVLNSSR